MAATISARGPEGGADVFLSDVSNGGRRFVLGFGWWEPAVDWCVRRSGGIVMEDSSDDAAPEGDWVQNGVVCPTLGARFEFLVVLLVFKGY